MEFEFLDLMPAIVEEKKKYATFKVVPIGGPAELARWKQDQEAKESVYRMRLGDKEARIEGFAKSTGHTIASPTIHTTSWAEKVAFAESERIRLAKAEENVTAYPPWEPPTEPKKSLLQRIRSFFAGIWTDANL